jgi:hypothetical protein
VILRKALDDFHMFLKASYYYFLLSILFLGCNPSTEISDQLNLEITEEGFINVIDTKADQFIIKNLYTGYHQDNSIRNIKITEHVNIRKTPFADKNNRFTKTLTYLL